MHVRLALPLKEPASLVQSLPFITLAQAFSYDVLAGGSLLLGAEGRGEVGALSSRTWRRLSSAVVFYYFPAYTIPTILQLCSDFGINK
jgi:hypothetical protein